LLLSSVHRTLPAVEIVPNGQLVQADRPAEPEYWPLEQAVHEVAEDAGEKDPAEHIAHADAPSEPEYWPGVHNEHVVLNPAWYLPAAQ